MIWLILLFQTNSFLIASKGSCSVDQRYFSKKCFDVRFVLHQIMSHDLSATVYAFMDYHIYSAIRRVFTLSK